VTCSDLFGARVSQWLGELPLPKPSAGEIASLR
jgi:hypothetical protein